ncbi:hypothetical protein CWO90_40520 [Bradyrhizobium sp. Leo121]|nr:hypothetical protein CWO90_40520 [Bradyrhizobium sp. Leo121]
MAKSGGLRFHSELPAVLAGVELDHKHSRAIVREIGERLRASLKPEPELPASIRTQVNRLRELESQSPSIIPAAERWDKPGR